jgi:hypothetical protein
MKTKYSNDTLEKLKTDFIELLNKIERPNANIQGLITKLESTDFFRAPASTKYHNAFEGGLVEHSLNVYYNLEHLVDIKGLKSTIPEESIIICGLLHDISKMNFYEPSSRNRKVYHENGSKYDELGRFDWVAEFAYKIKDASERFIYGNHEETSEFMIKTYIPLSVDESVAILNHHGGMSYDSIQPSTISEKYNVYPLAALLHMADFLATYIDENELA